MMKLRNLIFPAAVLAFTACQNDMDPQENANIETMVVDYLAVNEYINSSSEDADEREGSLSNARVVMDHQEREGRRPRFDHRIGYCAVVSTEIDQDANTLTITYDFDSSESCEGVSGMLTDVITAELGSMSHSSTFEQVTSPAGVVVDGTVSRAKTFSFDGEWSWGHRPPMTYEGSHSRNMTIAYPAGFVADSIEAYSETIVASIASKKTEEQWTQTGSKSYENTLGESFSVEITEELVYSRACEEKVFIPVSGVEVLTRGDETVTINYGEGACDYIVEVTKGDEVLELDLTEDFDEYGFIGIKARHSEHRVKERREKK
ncbi:hypothetical protein [Algivirga pacifica]|uniref:Lipoprotein n=1 Tax=Algivirga pacifica TaxID=1162670 RepID=A0ABP9DEY4_9BACT